jgi:hypothetical protein
MRLLMWCQRHQLDQQGTRPSSRVVPAQADGVVGEHQGEVDRPGAIDGDDVLGIAVQGDGNGCLAQPRVLDGLLDGRHTGLVDGGEEFLAGGEAPVDGTPVHARLGGDARDARAGVGGEHACPGGQDGFQVACCVGSHTTRVTSMWSMREVISRLCATNEAKCYSQVAVERVIQANQGTGREKRT